MTDPVAVALIVAVGPAVVSMVAAVVSLLNRWALQKLHLQINSRLDELLEATRKSARAEGRQDERDSQKKGLL